MPIGERFGVRRCWRSEEDGLLGARLAREALEARAHAGAGVARAAVGALGVLRVLPGAGVDLLHDAALDRGVGGVDALRDRVAHLGPGARPVVVRAEEALQQR